MYEPKRMGVGEFAKKMKVSRVTVYNWIHGKRMPPGIRAVMIAKRLVIELDEKH